MKLTVRDTENKAAGSIELPDQFNEPVREDLIIRSVLALQAGRRQPYGGYGNAGMRHSADLSKRRRAYRGTYGRGQSRVPRKIHSRRGNQMFQVGAIVSGTVGGRRAHGPKPFKDWNQKVNAKENRKAIRAALAATVIKDVVSARGHNVPDDYPFVIDDAVAKLSKTRDVEAALVKLGLAAEMERADTKRIRAGKGTMRGRKYKRPVSVLFVTGEDGTPLERAAANLPGTDVVAVHRLNAEILAPGTQPGRLTLFTKSAVERLGKEGLFTKDYEGPAEAPEKSSLKPKKPKKKKSGKKSKGPKKKTKSRKSTKKKKSSRKKSGSKKSKSGKSKKRSKKSSGKTKSKKSKKKKGSGKSKKSSKSSKKSSGTAKGSSKGGKK